MQVAGKFPSAFGVQDVDSFRCYPVATPGWVLDHIATAVVYLWCKTRIDSYVIPTLPIQIYCHCDSFVFRVTASWHAHIPTHSLVFRVLICPLNAALPLIVGSVIVLCPFVIVPWCLNFILCCYNPCSSHWGFTDVIKSNIYYVYSTLTIQYIIACPKKPCSTGESTTCHAPTVLKPSRVSLWTPWGLARSKTRAPDCHQCHQKALKCFLVMPVAFLHQLSAAWGALGWSLFVPVGVLLLGGLKYKICWTTCVFLYLLLCWHVETDRIMQGGHSIAHR